MSACNVTSTDIRKRNTLVEANAELVFYVANRWYRDTSFDRDDLIQEGQLGLIRAAEKYDPARGKFSTYAVFWIRNFMNRAIQNQSPSVRLPEHVANRKKKVKRLTTHGSTAQEVAEELDLTAVQVGQCLTHSEFTAVPYDEQDFDGDKVRPASSSEIHTRDVEGEIDSMMVKSALEILSDREREVIRLRYEDGLPLSDIGDRFGVTRERIRQIEARALKKLRPELEKITT